MSQYARYSGLGSGGGGGGSGVTTVGLLDSQTPSSNGLVIAGTTIYAQSASTTAPGLVNNTTQSFSGNKTFTGTIAASNLSGTNTGDVTIGTANGLSLSLQVLSLGLSSTSTTGALSSSDWNTFNNKQAAGSYITALTGDVSATGPGSAAATVNSVGGSSAANIHTAELAANAATDANTPSTIVKRDASGNFSASTITASLTGHASLDIPLTQKGAVNGVATLDGTGKVPLSQLPASLVEYQGTWDASTNTPTLSNSSGIYNVSGFFFIVSTGGTVNFGAGNITFNSGDWVLFNGSIWERAVQSNVVQSVNGQTGIVTVNAINQLTGDVAAGPASGSASASATIQPNIVSNSKLTQMAAHTYKGNNTGSTGNALDLTSTQVTADLNLFTSTLQGLVPASGGGTTTFLRADGTFATPPGTGTGTVSSVAFADSTGTFAVTGSPVTSTGTLTLSAFNSQAQNTFLAAPSGSAGAPTFRLITASDVPTLNQNTTGTASNVTGTVLIAHGGTGQTTPLAAFNALSPLTTAGDILYENSTPSAARLPIGSAGQVLTVSGGLPIWSNPATSGTVTSVALADGSTTPIFTISGSPVTSSGTLTETLVTQTANTVFAGPTSAGPTQPTFRSLIAADLPTGNLTDAGTDGITITNGTSAVIGTGTSIAQHVADTTHNGYLSSTDWNTFNNKQAAGNYITSLTGDVTATGPGSVAATLATVNGNVGTFGSSTSIPTFTVNAKGLITAASGNAVVAPAGTLMGTTLNATVVSSSLTSVGTITTGVWNGTTIDIGHGGTGQVTAAAAFAALSPLTTTGDIIYENNTPAPARLPIGTAGQVLTVSSGLPAWVSPATSGTVTSVAFSDGSTTPIFSISGSPVTSTGTITETLVNQTAATVFAGPLTGSPGQPTFRALASTDIPILNQNTTGSSGSVSGTNVITNSNLAQMPAHTYKGNNTGSTANAADITSTQLTADLNLFTTTLKGLVPGSGGGTANFLRADGTWSPATGSGGVAGVVFGAYLSTSTSFTANTPIKYDVVSFDSSTAYSTGTGIWTCPVSGYYTITVNIAIASTNSIVYVLVNGTDFVNLTQVLSSTVSYSGSALLQLNTNDTVAIQHDNGAAVSGGVNPQVSTFFITQDVSGSGTGTVTSVAFTDATNIFNVTGTPITTAGTISLSSLKSQSANTFLAAPNGSSGAPTFRTIVAADIPSLSATYLPLTGGTMSGAINMGSNQIHSVTDPTSAQDAATKAYVDNVAAGINPAVAVQAATTSSGNTSGFTYNNGVSGIGATFTGSVNTAVTIDGYTFTAIGQRLLVKNDTQSPSGAYNGVYYVTQVQTGLLAPIFTRALDYDQPSDINNTGAIPVINGTVNGTTQWVLTSLVNTVGTDPLTFSQFARNPADYLLKANNLSDVASKTTSFDNLSPMTTGGDIIYGGASGTGTRLANGSSGQVLTSNGGTSAPSWQTPGSGSNPFDFFVSSQVNTTSSAITSTSFTTFSNSPALTFTANFTGTYKVYCSIPTGSANSSSNPVCRVFNTSGSATLLAESWGTENTAAAINTTIFVQSVYTLTSGNSYTFDIQGLDINAQGMDNLGAKAIFYMFAERCG